MFKTIAKSLFGKKISVLFIIIQLSIINIAMYEIIAQFNIIDNHKSELESILQENKNNIINIKFQDLYPDENFANKTIELDKAINSQNQVEYSGGFKQTTMLINELANDSKFLDLQKKIYKGNKRENYIEATDTMFLDKNMDKFLNLEIAEGRAFLENDFNLKDGETVPVLAGSKLKGILSIGDTLNVDHIVDSDTGKRFVVVGFLKENSYSLSDSHFMEDEIINLDNFIIIPSYESNNNSATAVVGKACSYFVYAKDQNYIDNIKLNIKMEANKLGLNVECNTFNETYEKYKEDNSEMYSIIIITIIFLFIIVTFSITSSMLISIKKRKRELGIRIITGASKLYIKKMYLCEIILIMCISDIISFIYVISDYKNDMDFYGQAFNIMQAINVKALICILIFTFITVVISAFIPLRRIGELQPKELIGGNE